MGLTLATITRNAACNAEVDLIDVGAGANGTLVLRASTTTIATFNFDEPAFGNSSTGTATAAGFPKTVAASNTGVPDNYQVKDEDGTLLWSGTVAEGSGGDLNLDNTDINSGQNVTISSFTHTVPAS